MSQYPFVWKWNSNWIGWNDWVSFPESPHQQHGVPEWCPQKDMRGEDLCRLQTAKCKRPEVTISGAKSWWYTRIISVCSIQWVLAENLVEKRAPTNHVYQSLLVIKKMMCKHNRVRLIRIEIKSWSGLGRLLELNWLASFQGVSLERVLYQTSESFVV